MLLRMSWLLSMLIYLSVNGQGFATPTHLCQAMAMTQVTSLSSSEPLEIHEHLHNEEQAFSAEPSDNIFTQSTMENCQCVDCDCTENIVSQANSSIVYKVELVMFLSNSEYVTVKQEQNFISQPHSNLYRPPIFA